MEFKQEVQDISLTPSHECNILLNFQNPTVSASRHSASEADVNTEAKERMAHTHMRSSKTE